MKNFDPKTFFVSVASVVVALVVYDLGKSQLNKMKTKAPTTV